MSTITSTSTLGQVQASYVDNASYAEDSSVAKCKAFITACRVLILRLPAQTGTREAQLQLNPDLIQKEMKAAQEWLEGPGAALGGTSAGPRVTRASFENFR